MVTIAEIKQYIDLHKKLSELGNRYFVRDYLFDVDTAKFYMSTFQGKQKELNSLLVWHISDPQYTDQSCILSVLLKGYGITLPDDVLDFVGKNVTFPGYNILPITQQELHQNHTFITKNDSISLDKEVTLSKLSEITNTLESFVDPFLKFMDMLVFFHVHNSFLFKKYVKLHLCKLQSGNSKPQMLIFNFGIALSNTKMCILEIINGEAAFSVVVAEDKTILKQIDIEQEFAILKLYAKHFKIVWRDTQDGTQAMLELFQFTSHIENILPVCSQYLKGCVNDRSLQDLFEIRKIFMDHSKLEPHTAREKVDKVRKLLCFEKTTNPKCLDIFAEMTNSEDFYKFIQANKFYGDEGQALFHQQYDLITAQLQHQEYDESVLHHLKVAFQYITIFMDANIEFIELMTKIKKLDVAHGFKQLSTVNSNITLINLWFSRAEVSVSIFSMY